MVRNSDLVYGVVGDSDSTVGSSKVGIRRDQWAVAGVPLTVVEEVHEYDRLTLRFRVTDAERSSYVEPLKAGQGKIDVIDEGDGGFSVYSRTTEDNRWELQPPSSRVDPPLQQTATYFVEDVQEAAIDRDIGSWTAEVTFTPDADREPPSGGTLSESRASDQWSFAFRSSTITTKRVRAEIRRGSAADTGSAELELLLDLDQTRVVLEEPTNLAAVRTRQVPDGPNVQEDNAPNDENTVTVTTPDNESPIEDGDYAVGGWEATWLNDAAYRVRLELGKK